MKENGKLARKMDLVLIPTQMEWFLKATTKTIKDTATAEFMIKMMSKYKNLNGSKVSSKKTHMA